MRVLNRTLRCDWLPQRTGWRYLAARDYPLCPARKQFFHTINPLLTSLVRYQSSYLAILTSRLVNNPYMKGKHDQNKTLNTISQDSNTCSWCYHHSNRSFSLQKEINAIRPAKLQIEKHTQIQRLTFTSRDKLLLHEPKLDQ